ncbi:FAD-dependent pyridine nucleotide-disulfide oxidoreductase [Sulfuricurvum kujiense DSM 16994]|uniref:FAD-dependent pyridine nucleotide-disulfide oxidoreductase n=1 Tax=Sulfuricurvum kujiense (strain ATCC BAA-921 / DSM 16994 / JCM 11577 / YK-1) TaxID=709032 RepID=E4U1W4_SULKY|nr:FAD-dependent oxidoreductase [Sulfuricurvum kujiense]ADR33482.1 FAD-dependent pyridine nucleotide-disulfide oxidoreductase [Sulfuricurvum kujiense DSM 16994]
MQSVHVVIIGGGYGGIRAMEHLAHHSQISITLIDKNPYHYMQAEVYDFIANKVDMSSVMIDLPSLCKSFGLVEFVCEEVSGIDTQNSTVSTTAQTIPYDYLIIATGSRTYFPDFIKGLRQHSHGVKSIPAALDFKQQFERSLLNRIEAQTQGCDVKPFNIVIGGAGLSGVEIAAEMAAYANHFYANGNFGCRGVDVYLIDAYETILFGMDPYLIESAHQRLVQLGVHVWHNNRIGEVRENQIILDSGKVLDFEFMIFTGGIAASTLTQHLGFETNGKGHLIVDANLNIPMHENIYAIGDITQAITEEGKFIPPTAQLAERGGEHVARNILRSLKGKAKHPFTYKNQGVMIALGGEYGAGLLPGGIKVKGYAAYLIKKAIFWLYSAPLRRRSNIGKRR